MLLVTGDVHADMDDFRKRPFGRIRKNDCVLVCGDFGILWDGGREEKKEIVRLGRRKYHTLFIDGAHENFDLLESYPVTEWNGGKVRVISGNLLYLMRGQVYTIGGRKVFTFGGGESPDRQYRAEHRTWWPQEMPTEPEMAEGLRNLEENGWLVDYIVTHDAPTGFKHLLEEDDEDFNRLNVYLERVHEQCRFKRWIFANYHVNKRMSSDTEAVFDGVIRLE